MITSSDERIALHTDAGHWIATTLHELLARNVLDRGDELAVADQPNRFELTGDNPNRLSFSELDQASDGLACALLEAGLRANDFLLVQLPNISELIVAYYAASKLGLIISPVPIQYGNHELNHIAGELKPGAMLTCERFKKQYLATNASGALPDTPVLCFGKNIPSLTDCVEVSSVQREKIREHLQQFPATPNDILTVCWTSGTTGTPKGVPRSHNMWMFTAKGNAMSGGFEPGHRLLVPFPLVNMAALGGFLFPSALLGCSIVLHHPFDVDVYLRQLQDERVMFTIGPPAILNQLANSPEKWAEYDFSDLRGIGSGSAPLSPRTIDIFEQKYKKQVVNYYGSNEGISLHSTPQTSPTSEIRASMFPRVGIKGTQFENLRPGVYSKVADPETGEEITEPGVSGELLFGGATVFDGYYKHDNVGVFTEDGFFRTGDLVEICGDPPDYPYYRIVGRCKDIINRGGMKISPSELDMALEHHPDVLEAAVCAYPDERLGEKICACLVMHPDKNILDLASLQAYMLEQGFAKFKLPERIEAMDELPRNPLGKVQRFALEKLISAIKR